ncbi:hypothetical protein ACJZ2D_001369 [Fusarium nematophilum]
MSPALTSRHVGLRDRDMGLSGPATRTTTTALPRMEARRLDLRNKLGQLLQSVDAERDVVTVRDDPLATSPSLKGETLALASWRSNNNISNNSNISSKIDSSPSPTKQTWASRDPHDKIGRRTTKVPSESIPVVVPPPPRRDPRRPIRNGDTTTTTPFHPDAPSHFQKPNNNNSNNNISHSQSGLCHRIEEDVEDIDSCHHHPPDLSLEIVDRSLRPSPPSSSKIMTSAQFEDYRGRRDSHVVKQQQHSESDDEDTIDYDDEGDVEEVPNQHRKQRRQQEAHILNYRQRMMKTAGETTSPLPNGHKPTASIPTIRSPPRDAADQDEDDDVPLAYLQVQGFNSGSRPPTRLAGVRSNPSLRSETQENSKRPGSAHSKAPPKQSAHSPLPVFARKLPQDPFAGGGGLWPLNDQRALYPGGGPSAYALGGMAPTTYGVPGMQQTPPQGPPQTPQYLQTQVEFMQMMNSMNQQRIAGMALMQQQPYQNMMGIQPMNGFPLQQQMPLDPWSSIPRHMNPGMRNGGVDYSNFASLSLMPQSGYAASGYTPSVYAPSLYAPSTYAPSTYAASTHRPGTYTPSIAPSERSNVGLPSRYRPVSRATSQVAPDTHIRTSNAYSVNGGAATTIGKAATNGVSRDSSSDDDDEEGWRTMKEKQDRRRAVCMGKKDMGIETEGIMWSGGEVTWTLGLDEK